MRIIITGGRNYDDYKNLKLECISILQNLGCPKGDIEIVSGGASGADALGERFARNQEIPVKVFKADWAKYGRSAGPRRNKLMSEYADVLIAFPGGTGTANMIYEMNSLNKKVYIIE